MEDERSNTNRELKIDPSSLTTQMVLREIASLKELFDTHIDRIDQSISVAHADMVRVPTEVQKSVTELRNYFLEKIDNNYRLFEQRFDLVERYRVEQKTDTATALTAALNAAKEAVSEQNKSNGIAISKSEASTTKQIDQMGALISATANISDNKINDVKERLAKIENAQTGIQVTGTASHEGSRNAWAIVASVIGLILLVLTLVTFFQKLIP